VLIFQVIINMRISTVATLFFSGVAVALPARPECNSNFWEKLHEGHWHDINTGVWFGLPIHLTFPGGTGCYKGTKTVAGPVNPSNDEEPDLSKLPAGMNVSWMPGYAEASKNWKKKPTSAPDQQYAPAPAPAPAPYQQYSPAPAPGQSAGFSPSSQQIPYMAVPEGMHLQLEPDTLEAAKNWDRPEIQQFQPGKQVPQGWHLELVGVINSSPNQQAAPEQAKEVVDRSGWHVQSVPALSSNAS
jgi:hypothetical protein